MTELAQDFVILVDEQDRERGLCEKIQAHEQGILHRAFSVFVFRGRGARAELLLQKRATSKYHFGGLWTNSCCGHPRQGETPVQAGVRRLQQEMGLSVALVPAGSFIYSAPWTNGLSEHEYDHVLVGLVDDTAVPVADPAEADDYRWLALDELARELAENPERFTPWFARAFALAKQQVPS